MRNYKYKKSELEVEVTKKLPTIARSIILQDQLEFYQKGIYQNYQSYNKINEKLEQLGEEVKIQELQPEIKNFILNEIEPDFNQEKTRTKTMGGLITSIALIVTLQAVFPDIFFPIILFVGCLLFCDIVDYSWLIADGQTEKKSVYLTSELLLMAIGALMFFQFAYVLYSGWSILETTHIIAGILICVLGLTLSFTSSLILEKFTMAKRSEI